MAPSPVCCLLPPVFCLLSPVFCSNGELLRRGRLADCPQRRRRADDEHDHYDYGIWRESAYSDRASRQPRAVREQRHPQSRDVVRSASGAFRLSGDQRRWLSSARGEPGNREPRDAKDVRVSRSSERSKSKSKGSDWRDALVLPCQIRPRSRPSTAHRASRRRRATHRAGAFGRGRMTDLDVDDRRRRRRWSKPRRSLSSRRSRFPAICDLRMTRVVVASLTDGGMTP